MPPPPPAPGLSCLDPPAPEPGEAARAARTRRYLTILDRAIDVTARHIDRLDIQAQTDPASEIAIPLERTVRSLRQTIALAQKLAEPPKPRAEPRQRAKVRERILREVTDIIQRRAETEADEIALLDELDQRIDSPEMAEDIEDTPVETIITDLVRDLGLAHLAGTHPWARRTPADITELRARAQSTQAQSARAQSTRVQSGSDPP